MKQLQSTRRMSKQGLGAEIKKSPHQRASYHSGVTAPLRIFHPSPSGGCPAETANFLLMLMMSYHRPIMIGGVGGSLIRDLETSTGLMMIEPVCI